MNSMHYRPDVDGLRAVAILFVLLFHAGLGLSGGFVGVDVFFVISGFLITRLIVTELDAGSFCLKTFWARRIGRILPAATVMVLSVLVTGFFLLLPKDYEELGASVITQQAIAANVFFWRHTGYFEGPADMKPLLHTWSLAVEEQFYLLYPWLLVLLHRFGRYAVFAALTALAAASFVASVYGVDHHPAATFFLLPTRAWEMLLGALVSFMPQSRHMNKGASETLSLLALAGILLPASVYDASTPFPGYAASVPCIGAAILIYSNTARLTIVGRALALPPFVAAGLLSYSIYLWHWPIFAYIRYWCPHEIPPWAGVVSLLASMLISWGSYRYIETPLRERARRTARTTVFLAACVSAIAVALAGFAVFYSGGFPHRLPPEAQRYLENATHRESTERTVEQWESGAFPLLGSRAAATQNPDFFIWGDSHSGVVADTVDTLALKLGLTGVIAAEDATIPVPGVANRFSPADTQARRANAAIRFIHDSGVKHVLLIANWQIYAKIDSRFSAMAADPRFERTPAGKELLLQSLDDLCTDLGRRGISVWIMKRIPCQSLDPNKRLATGVMLGSGLPRGISRHQYDRSDGELNTELARLASRHPHVNIVDAAAACFDDDGASIIGDADGSYYRDPDHLSPRGAERFLTPALLPCFRSIKASRQTVGHENSRID